MVKARIPISIVYFLLVLICVLLAFDFDGAIDPTWTLVLIAVTLPGSLVSILFAWSLIHGAGLEFFAFVYLASAGFNIFVFNWIISRLRRVTPNDAT
ncbi:MAG: hypothetical protein SF097_24195 [Acidobacteriota bacterium]|nr:hypothetical protein [Acidobacteriota bacterium]